MRKMGGRIPGQLQREQERERERRMEKKIQLSQRVRKPWQRRREGRRKLGEVSPVPSAQCCRERSLLWNEWEASASVCELVH